MKHHIDLRLKLNKKEQESWDAVIKILSKALKHNGRPGGVLREYRNLVLSNPDKAELVRAKTVWLDELLRVIGE